MKLPYSGGTAIRHKMDLATIKRGFLVPTTHHTLKRQYHLQQHYKKIYSLKMKAAMLSIAAMAVILLATSSQAARVCILIVYAYCREEVVYFIEICPLHRQGTQCAPVHVQPTTFSTATGSVSVYLPQEDPVPLANHGTFKPAGASSRAAIRSALLARHSTSIHALVSAHHARQVKLGMWTALVAFSPSSLSKRGLCYKGPVEIYQGRTAS